MLAAIIVVHIAFLLLNLAMWLQLKGFLARTERIESDADLAAYKRVVKTQMLSTLLGFALAAAPWLLWLVGHFGLGSLTWSTLGLWVAIPWIVNVGLVVALAAPANRAKQLESENDKLAREVAVVVQTWKNKALPNW